MKLSFKSFLLYLVKRGIIEVKFLLLVPKLASSFAAPSNDKEISHSSRRDLQVTCTGGLVLNACANCCGYQFTTREDLQDAVNAYSQDKTTADNTYGEINCWDVSSITDMSILFYLSPLNEPIECWNVGSVTDMTSMFYDATNFNQPIGNWNVGSVTNMYAMFAYATNFNQSIGNWNVGSVTDMASMFDGATNFNQPIGNWNVGSVTNMYNMFYGATNFNQPIGNWTVGSVTNMGSMFFGATKFNQDLCSWYNKLPSTTTFTDYYDEPIFDGTSCPNKAIPDLQVKASFCRTCQTNNGGVQGGTLRCLIDPLIIKNHVTVFRFACVLS
jgi:surface protein